MEEIKDGIRSRGRGVKMFSRFLYIGMKGKSFVAERERERG